MDKNEYKKLVKKHTPKENKMKNALISFVSGGLLGIIGLGLCDLFKLFGFSNSHAIILMLFVLIFFSCLFTCLGFFDNWMSYCKCGLIVPITGFAHSVCSAILDYKKDGMITGIGSNTFKLAGSVILYGIISSFIFVLIRVIIYG